MLRKPKIKPTSREVVERACAEYAKRKRKRQERIKAQAIQEWISRTTETLCAMYNSGLSVPAAVASLTGQGGPKVN